MVGLLVLSYLGCQDTLVLSALDELCLGEGEHGWLFTVVLSSKIDVREGVGGAADC